MPADLESLKKEVLSALKLEGLTVFHGFAYSATAKMALWNSEGHSDVKEYLAAAKAVGVKMVSFNTDEFFPEELEEVQENLKQAFLAEEDERQIKQRLDALNEHTSKICSINLTFDHNDRAYLFEIETEWYTEFKLIRDAIQPKESEG